MATDSIDAQRGRYVRTLLAWHGKTRTDLAELLGLTVHSVYKRLDGRRAFRPEELLKIADWLGVDAGLLLRPPELVEALGVPSPPSASTRCIGAYPGQWAWDTAYEVAREPLRLAC